MVSERCGGALVSFFRVLSLLHHCNKTRVYFFVGDMAVLHGRYNLQIFVPIKFLPVFSVSDYFVGILGGFRWAILILKLLTCKCNPQYSTRSFSLTFHLNGAIGVDQILFRLRVEMLGCGAR